MSVSLACKTIKFEDNSRTVTVPGNDLAKLMYYLECVSSLINYSEIKQYTDYQKYYLLSSDDQAKVCAFALLFNPKLLLNANIFIIEPRLLTSGTSNKFLKITDDRIGVHVDQEIVIEGRAVKVLEIMVCNESWIDKNYYKPLANLLNSYSSTETVTNLNNNNTYANYNSSNTSNYCSCKKCCISTCVILVGLMIISGLISYFGSKGDDSSNSSD